MTRATEKHTSKSETSSQQKQCFLLRPLVLVVLTSPRQGWIFFLAELCDPKFHLAVTKPFVYA
ncbi:hypothetical protein M514_25621 [Trichuris suis]|uniref:Uncharacterized protein n=1 Tax=Trichuris suis TaxID=68888 RepID=A0A085MYD5_9BILA|nr:hypothetical protein M514_25621 [Trichuris suis]